MPDLPDYTSSFAAALIRPEISSTTVLQLSFTQAAAQARVQVRSLILPTRSTCLTDSGVSLRVITTVRSVGSTS